MNAYFLRALQPCFLALGNGSEWDIFVVSRSLGSTSPRCPSPTGCDVLRALALEKTEKENFTEMAEATTTLKGLRAQMGKKILTAVVII